MAKLPSRERTLFRPAGASTTTGELGPALTPRQLRAVRRNVLGASLVIGGTMFAYFLAYQTVWHDQRTIVGPWVASISTVKVSPVT